MAPADDNKPEEKTNGEEPSKTNPPEETGTDVKSGTGKSPGSPEDTAGEGTPEGDDGEGDEENRKKSSKKKLVIILSAVLGFVIVGGATAYLMGWLNPLLGIEEEHKVAEISLSEPVSFVLPQIKADLKTGACRSPFLRVTISVQLPEQDLSRLQESEDKVIDQIITHLRDQERQDLVGKAGSDQLRFDLVKIINNTIKPVRIHGIIFKEFVLQ